jgi:ABC-2 type transport system ATP-binding protein
MASTPMIEVSELRKSYGGRTVVDGVSFTVEEGEIFGILGPNGAGKTTTVECVEGLRVPDAGRVRVAGLDPVADHAAVTPGARRPAPGERAAGQAHRPRGPRAVRRLVPEPGRLAAAGRTPRPDRQAEHPVRCPQSGGQKQRLFIALALIGNPRIVVLDELTTGLDPRARRDTWELVEDVRANGVTVLLVTHFMEEAQRLCDRIAVIDKGRVTALDTPRGTDQPDSAGSTVISFTPSAPLDDADLARCRRSRRSSTRTAGSRSADPTRPSPRCSHAARPAPHHRPPAPRHRRHAGRRLPRPHDRSHQMSTITAVHRTRRHDPAPPSCAPSTEANSSAGSPAASSGSSGSRRCCW